MNDLMARFTLFLPQYDLFQNIILLNIAKQKISFKEEEVELYIVHSDK